MNPNNQSPAAPPQGRPHPAPEGHLMPQHPWCDGCKDYPDSDGVCFCHDVHEEIAR